MKKVSLPLILMLFFLSNVFAAENSIPLIGSRAPSFTAQTTTGELTFPESFGKSWKILFSHPQDFTPVCSSELLELAYYHDEFEKLGIKVAVISTDELEVHNLWKAHLEELDYKDRGPQKILFPIIDDYGASASKKYGMLHEPVSTTKDVRGVFVIDGSNIIRSVNFYPMEIGRNIDELLRVVAALKTSDEEKVFTPANWNVGEDVLIPHFPYTDKELSENPDIQKDYYSVGNRLWFKRIVR